MSTKNKLKDLNDHLFWQIESLKDESLKGEKLKEAISRGKAAAMLGARIIDAHRLVLQAVKSVKEGHIKKEDIPELLGNRDNL